MAKVWLRCDRDGKSLLIINELLGFAFPPAIASRPWLQNGERDSLGIRDHFELAHHGEVLVLEVVAVKDVATGVFAKLGQNGHFTRWRHYDRVLPAKLGRLLRHAVDIDHLELHKVQMHRMGMIR